ncbi:hypothetical protein ACFY8K_16685 [Streptomyces misionensis]|uniref:hypothetical protein n=1 Tax=Streptomyces misionensis TaxID=67331 RepID=UPI0036787C31
MPGGLAARVMGWQRRMGVAAGPLGASGESSTGDPVTVELLVGGAWVDITGYTMVRDESGTISITSGIRDEGSQTEAGTCSLELKNQDGRFSPRNPMGPYYGAIGRNTPIRISVPDGLGGKSYRIWGEVSSWAPGWDTSGTDVYTNVSANGILQRLAQGPAPAHSVIYTAITSPQPSGLVAYWPCEDASGSTSLASALTSGSPMTWTGTPDLASYSGFAASDPLPDLSVATLSGGVAAYADPTATQVRFLAYIPASGLSDGKVLCSISQQDYAAGAPQFWELYYSTTDASNSLVLRSCASDGTTLGAILPHTLDVRGRLLYVSVEMQETGADITRAIRLVDVTSGRVYSVTDTQFVTQLTRVTKISFGTASRSAVGPLGTATLPGVAIGHVTVESQITAVNALGVRLNPIGESAGRRIQRLCGEAGLAFDWVGDLDDTVPMGAQGKANLLSLVQECALADGGLLYETRGALGLGYRTRASLYNQDPTLILDYPSANLAQVPTPVEDDRYIQNKITITCGGVTATYEQTTGTLSTQLPPAGVGEYGQDTTLNLASTDAGTLQDQAAWRVHLGTVDEARFPSISVNLAHPSISPDMRRAILAMRPGDRIQITNPPAWLPPDTIDQLVIGTSETLTRFEHKLTFNCQPASPYSYVGILDTTARIDTDGSQILGPLTTTTTAFSVQPTDPYDILWTTDPADMPLDIQAGGEVMRVTSITDIVSDAFTRTVTGGWGSSGVITWSTTGGTASDYSVNGSAGAHLLATVNVPRYTYYATTIADVDCYVSVTTDQLPAGDSLVGGLTARFINVSNLYMAQVRFTTAAQVAVAVVKRVGGVETMLGSYTMPATTFTGGTFYRLRFKVKGSSLKAKIWPATDAEPAAWAVSVLDTDLISTQFLSTRSFSGPASTNTNPSILYDDYRIASPQLFQVIRSINGVTKSHPAGEALSLAHPTVLAL